MGFHRRLAVALLAALPAVARAEDPPAAPPKHENRISPEAKAAMEKFRSLVYRPEDHGLVSVTFDAVPIGFESRDRLRIEYVPPADLRVTLPPVLDREMRRSGMWPWTVKGVLYLAFDVPGMFDYAEIDADLVRRGDECVITATEYEDGKRSSSDDFVLRADGLVTRRVHRAEEGSASTNFTATFTWVRHADLDCLAAFDVTLDVPNLERHVFTLRYTDVAGVHLPTSCEMTYAAKDAAPKTFSFFVDGLVLNGKKVDLPTPWKHVNNVSPEAMVAMERYAKLVHRPTEHGLVSLSGKIVAQGAESSKPRGFSFKAAGHVGVESAPGADPNAGGTRMGRVMLGFPLEATLAGIPVADGGEYDAAFVERDGGRALVVTNYKDGAKKRIDEFTFDATGLLSSAAIGTRAPGGGIAMKMQLSWEASGERHRIRAIDWTAGLDGGAGSMRMQYELEYGEVGGIAMVTSYTLAASGAAGDQSLARKATFRLADLLLNGKKVESPKPASGDAK